jgi:resorcinol 4-hydroxylase (NADPH)
VYGAERAPNMEAVIDLAIEMGKMVCVTDPDEAAARDEAFRAVYDGSISEIPPFPGLTEGVILAGTPQAGELFVQGIVEHHGLRGRFDDVVGAGWRLVSSRDVRMDPDLADWFAGIGGRVVAVGADTGVVDVEGTYAEWFARHDVVAALQRPDFYVFGTAASHDDVDRLLAMLRRELQHP